MTIIKTKTNSRKITGRRTISRKIKTSKIATGFIIAVLICLLGGFYIVQTSGVTAGNYDIESQEEKLNDLKNENQNLMIELAKLRSMPQLEEMAGEFNMVALEKADYITSSGSAMAVR